jgi:hypothetical protein
MVAGIMARHAANDGTFQAAFGFSRHDNARQSQYCGGAPDESLHSPAPANLPDGNSCYRPWFRDLAELRRAAASGLGAAHDDMSPLMAARRGLRVCLHRERAQERRKIMTIRLKDGREVSRSVARFKGTPQRPLDQAELREKFMLLTRQLERSRMEATFERLQHIETGKTLDWVGV